MLSEHHIDGVTLDSLPFAKYGTNDYITDLQNAVLVSRPNLRFRFHIQGRHH